MSGRIIPDIVAKRPPSLDQHARELYRLEPTREAYCWEAKGDRETGYVVLTGRVFLAKYMRGRRKGHTNFKKPEDGTLRTVTLPNVAHRAWLSQWERETGYCAPCEGTGQEWCGWSVKDGSRHRTCRVCDGNGTLPDKKEAAVAARSEAA